MGRVRNPSTLVSTSLQILETRLREIPSIASALTRSSTLRVEACLT